MSLSYNSTNIKVVVNIYLYINQREKYMEQKNNIFHTEE